MTHDHASFGCDFRVLVNIIPITDLRLCCAGYDADEQSDMHPEYLGIRAISGLNVHSNVHNTVTDRPRQRTNEGPTACW